MKLRIAIKKERVIEEYQKHITDFIEYKTKGAPEDFQQFMYEFLEYQSKLMIKRIDEVLQKRLYVWAPLSPSYLWWKQRMGLSPKTWIASGQTKRAIKYWYNKPSDSFFIGVHPTQVHRGYFEGGVTKKVRFADIIRWMEAGTPKMPARPLFSKVMQEFEKPSRQKQLYADFIKEKKGL